MAPHDGRSKGGGTMRNYYAEAMEIITDNNLDWRAVVIEIAKKNPSLIVKATDKQNNSLVSEVRLLLRANRKINAIKRWRQATGLGLKEAKEVVENIKY
jgi:ribosomal protein L7/L12